MRTNLSVLAGADLGPEFSIMVDVLGVLLPPLDERVVVLLDDLPDASARLRLVRLAVIAALEEQAGSIEVLPVDAREGNLAGTEWLISRKAARGFTFANGETQPSERIVTLKDGRCVGVGVDGARVEVPAPSEQECLRLLDSVARSA